MTLYQRNQSQPLKWVVALIVFGLALGFTFSNVEGYNGNDRETGANVSNADDGTDGGSVGRQEIQTDDALMPAPEPGTILLLAGGLGAMYAVRRRKKRVK